MNTLIWENLHRFFDHLYLGCTQRECKPNESMVDENRKCSNHESLHEQLKKFPEHERVVRTSFRGPTTSEDMRRNPLNGTANWQTKQSCNCFRSPHHVLTTTVEKRKTWKGGRTCHALVDRTFYRRKRNWHEQSQKRQEHVTKAWLVS